MAELAALAGVPAALHQRVVFATSGLFTAAVLVVPSAALLAASARAAWLGSCWDGTHIPPARTIAAGDRFWLGNCCGLLQVGLF